MSDVQFITTADGSHSLLNTALDETYHSRHGAIQESLHVFINKGFDFFIERHHTLEIHILEIGFGTGLNALLTLQQAVKRSIKVYYTSIEAFPLAEDIWRKLNYSDTVGSPDEFIQLHQAPWSVWQSIHNQFHLLKLADTFQNASLAPASYDLIYFDAFAPNKQPELWELPVIERTAQLLKPGGVFVTYCAKGQLKRDLKSVGLTLETLDGPPGKKEMVRAVNQK